MTLTIDTLRRLIANLPGDALVTIQRDNGPTTDGEFVNYEPTSVETRNRKWDVDDEWSNADLSRPNEFVIYVIENAPR